MRRRRVHAADLSRQPVFQALFALQNVPTETLQLPGLQLSRMGGAGATSKFDLSLHLFERDGGLSGFFEYASDLFDGSTIERLAGHLKRLLAGIAADPDVAISALPLLTAERLAFMLSDARSPVLVTQARLVAELPAHDGQIVRIDADWAGIAAQPLTAPRNATLPDNLAYVIYTSGSTGRPKGVGKGWTRR